MTSSRADDRERLLAYIATLETALQRETAASKSSFLEWLRGIPGLATLVELGAELWEWLRDLRPSDLLEF